MNLRTTFTLLLLILVGGGLWAVVAWRDAASPPGATVSFLDEDLRADRLRRIEIKRGPNHVILDRTGDEWSLPGKWPVRQVEVKQLLTLLDNLGSRFTPIRIKDPGELKSFGLDADPLRLELKVGETYYSLLLGEDPNDTNRFARSTYLRLGKKAQPQDAVPAWENEVVRLGPGLIALLDRPADYYQQRRLFPAERVAKEPGAFEKVEELTAKALSVKAPDANYTISKTGDEWQISAPVKDRVNPDKLRAILTGMPDIWAEYFVPAKGKGLEEFGLKEPEQTLTVTRPSGATVTLLVGKVADTKVRVVKKDPPPFGPPGKPQMDIVHEEYRFAKLQDNEQIFAIKSDKLKDVALNLDALRDPQVARFKTDDVRRVEIKRDKDEIVLVKEKDKWRLQKPKEQDAEASAITELLDKLAGLNASGKDIIDKAEPKDYGLDKGIAVKLGLEEGKEKKGRELTLTLGVKEKAKEKKLYVQVAGWPRVNGVDDAVLKLTQRPALAYRSKRALDVKTADIEKIEVQRGDETYALEHTKDIWRLAKPVSAEVDASKAEQLAGELSRLEAVEYISDATKAEDLEKASGLAKPTLRATFSLAGKKEPLTLKIGKQRDGKQEYFAQLSGGSDSTVFVVKKEVRETLDRDSLSLRPPSIWKLAGDDIREVRISKEGSEYRLKKDGEAWKIAGGFEASAVAEEVRDLTEDLAGLRAEKYVAHSAKDKDLAKFGLDKPYLKIAVATTDKKDAKEKELHIGSPTEKAAKSRFARLSDSDAVFVLAEKAVEGLDHSALDFLDRKLLALDAKKIQRITSKQSAGSFTLQEQKGEWELVDSPAPKFKADVDEVKSFIQPWPNLRAKKYAAYGPKIDWSAYGLDKPTATITVSVAGKDEKDKSTEHTLTLGGEVKDSPGSRYARLDRQDAVVVLDAADAKEVKRTHLDFIHRNLLTHDFDAVKSIHRAMNGNEMEIAKQDDAWKILKPVSQPADAKHVEAILEKTFRLRAERIAAYPAKDLGAFGLDKPAAVVTLRLGDPKEKPASHLLKVGKVADEKSGERFALVDGGDKVVVLSGELSRHLTSPDVHFRDHNLTPFTSADKVVLERGNRKVTFRKIDGVWKMIEPTAADAEDAELDEFVRSIARFRADEIVAEKPGKLETYGLAKPQAVWRFSAGDKEVAALSVGKEAAGKSVATDTKEKTSGQRVHAKLANSDLVVLLDAKLSSRTLAEYRARKPWKAPDAVQVEKITFAYAKTPFTLEKKDNTWQVAGDANAKIDAKAVTDTLDALSALQAERFVVDKGADLQLYGLKPAVLTIEIHTATAKHVLHIGRNEGDSKRVYATSPESPGEPVFIISETDAGRIVRGLGGFVQSKGG